eukprot:scaffold129682_cov21-Prasinocladus_malaysianus.AAC.1
MHTQLGGVLGSSGSPDRGGRAQVPPRTAPQGGEEPAGAPATAGGAATTRQQCDGASRGGTTGCRRADGGGVQAGVLRQRKACRHHRWANSPRQVKRLAHALPCAKL